MTTRAAESDRVVLLRRVEHGDSDLVLTFLAREHGKIATYARGARRSRRRFAGCLSWFSIAQVQLSRKRGSELYTVASADLERDHTALASDPATLAHASYATELSRELLAPEQPETAVFDLLTRFYALLRDSGAARRPLRVFELSLLSHLGLAPSFENCARCHQASEGALDRGAILDPHGAGIVCASCAPQIRGGGVRPISGAARRELIAASRQTLAEAAAAPSSALAEVADQIEGGQVMKLIISRYLSSPLRSLEFIAKLSRSPTRA